jgi:hypothetical protein
MAVPSRPQDREFDPAGEVDDPDRIPVSTHCTNPDRTVFIEEDNSDGWIATDFVVSLDP